MEEQWKKIEDFDYEISNLGQVKNLKTKKILKPYLGLRGYFVVQLYKDKKQNMSYIHRLIASAFIPNPENKECVDHINRDRTDNRIENLRWVSKIENGQNNTKVINKNSGEMYIQQYFKVSINNSKINYQKNFDNLEDAIKARDEILLKLNLTTADSSC